MAETSRINGLIGTLGIKAPARAATTANIVLSGLQTLDGVVLAAGDRVLVKNQTIPSENGLYYVETGAWTRAPDFDGARDVVTGTVVNVNEGSTYALTHWRVSTLGDILPGTTSLTFEQTEIITAGATVNVFNYLTAAERTDVTTRAGLVNVLPKIQQAINVASANGGGIVLLPSGLYMVNGFIELKANVFLQGEGSGATEIRLTAGANTDILRTVDFATLTLSNKWTVAEGVPTGFGFDGILFNGQRTLQAVAGGVKIYGKKYRIGFDVQIVSMKGVGFYSECAYKGGETVPGDQPEGYIGKLQVWESGQENIIYRGPHDQPIGDMYSALAGRDGVYNGVVFDGKTNVYQGITYVNGTVHSYASSGHGVVCQTQMMLNKVSGESNLKSGIIFETSSADWIGAFYTNVNYLEAYHNDVNGTGLYWNFENRVTGTTIGNIRFTTSTVCAGSLYNTGTNLTIHGGVILAAGAVAHGTAYKNAAQNANVKAQIILWDNAADVAFETATASFCHFDLNFLNCNNGKIWLNSGVSTYNKYTLHSASASGTPFTNTGSLSATDTFDVKIVVNGVPYLSEYNDIQRAITNGNTVATVTHNAFKTPTAGQITITPNSDWRNAGVARTWWISNITATTFDINTDVAAPVAGLTFFWKLDI